MTGRDDDDPVILSTTTLSRGRSMLAEVEEYWRGLMRGGRLPSRSDVDPSRIEGALPHAFIVERVAPGVARIRIAGQALCGHLGAEARGMPLSVFFEAASRDVLAGHLDHAFDGPALIDVGIACIGTAGCGRQRGRLLLLPLLGPEGTVSRLLGALLIDGGTRRAPHRFEIPPDTTLRVQALAVPRIPRAMVVGAGTPGPGLSEAQRPWLRLVVSNV